MLNAKGGKNETPMNFSSVIAVRARGIGRPVEDVATPAPPRWGPPLWTAAERAPEATEKREFESVWMLAMLASGVSRSA
jgi:hypothetical protein